MCDIPDHPDIRWVERTGYPRGTKDNDFYTYKVVCKGCGEPIWDDEEKMKVPEGWIHDDCECLRKYIKQLNNGEL